MNAGVTVKLAVQSSVRYYAERFTPTRTYGEDWVFKTSLDSYQTELLGMLITPWNYMQSELANGVVCKIHLACTLENVTAPEPYIGMVKLAKGHIDADLTSDEAATVEALYNHVALRIQTLQTRAKY